MRLTDFKTENPSNVLYNMALAALTDLTDLSFSFFLFTNKKTTAAIIMESRKNNPANREKTRTPPDIFLSVFRV